MKKSSPPEPALLFVGTLYHKKEYLIASKEKLTGLFGEIIMESQSLDWDYSDYYKDELGWPIKRAFVFFKNNINPEALADIKLMTNDIEQQLAIGGKRNINLDPGYLTPSKVVLASTKNYSHRLCIGRGIYAEVTLIYKDNRYQPHLFTYRDYASDAYREIFAQARELLIKS
jgi:hypothetical protein